MSRFLLMVILAVGVTLSGCAPPEDTGGAAQDERGSEKAAKDEQPAREKPNQERPPKPDEKKAKPEKPVAQKANNKPALKPKPPPPPPKAERQTESPSANPEPRRSGGNYDATVTVSRVVDGDTIEITPAINGVKDVRLIGVDTPETVDPGEEVEPYGPEASAYVTDELTGEKVDLEFDAERIDQYDRLLAYVYAGDSMFNEELLEEGYAQAYPYPPNTTYEMRFEKAQRKAKARDLGIWSLPLSQQCLLADRGNSIGEGSIGCDLMAEESASPSASPSPSASADSSATAQPSGGGAVAPISEDDCPQHVPIKGNQSGLYHVPGGAYYDVTNPEECFATAQDAEAAGYEASSR